MTSVQPDGSTDEPRTPQPELRVQTTRWWSALAGIASAIAGLGAAQVIAAPLAPASSPLLVVGSLVIDMAPGWVKDLVISLFDTGDKVMLLTVLALVAVGIAATAGVLERARSPWGRVLIALLGSIGVVAAITRADTGQLAAVPSLAAILTGVIVLGLLSRRLAKVRAGEAPASATRRSFLIAAGTSAGLGALALIGGRVLTAGRQATHAVRTAFQLPKPTAAVAPSPTGASFDVSDLSPLVTPNASFYRIDTALQVPVVDPQDWALKVTGMVEREMSISFDELLALHLEESYTTLACVSNYVGGDLIGNAKWLGYPIREVLKRAGVAADADMVLSTSADGFTASTPLTALTDDRNAILAIGMNDEPLPFEHGFPVRMVVPGLYGYVSATKWVTQLEVTTFAKHSAYWTERGWSDHGPIKLSSRIDVPRSGAGTIHAGTVTVAGVAWAQHTGVSRVQLRVDDGEWNDAELADAISEDTWRQWRWVWPAEKGHHALTVRATDAHGKVQTTKLADVVPDGATGLHSVDVTVS